MIRKIAANVPFITGSFQGNNAFTCMLMQFLNFSDHTSVGKFGAVPDEIGISKRRMIFFRFSKSYFRRNIRHNEIMIAILCT